MALTYEFKQSMKQRRRRWRRFEVVTFGVMMVLGLVEGGIPLGWGNLGVKLMPYVLVLGRIYKTWRWQKTVKVRSLDDRAMLEHGVLFEQLNDAKQKEMLRRYQVGTYIMGYYPDEREENTERDSNAVAYGILRWLLPVLAGVYWVGWRLLPEGEVRVCWTNGPTVLAWMFLLVLALPELIQLWTEPDVIAEVRVVAGVDA